MFTLWLALLLSPALAAEVDDGYARLAAGANDEARELFLKARRDDAQAAMASRGLALLAAAGDTKAESALTSARKDPAGKAGLGWLALTRATASTPPDAARLEEARAFFAEATVADAELALAWYGLAEVYIVQGDDAAAVRPLATARRLDPALPMANTAEKKLRSRYMATLAAQAAKGSLSGAPMMPLDPALHDEMQLWIESVVRRSAAADAEKGITEIQALSAWMKTQGDLCGAALLRVASGRVALRLDLRAPLLTEIDAGLNEVSACADAPRRKAQAQLARAELSLLRGEPLSAVDTATAARTAAAEAKQTTLQVEAGLLLTRALLAADKLSEAEAVWKAAEPLVGSGLIAARAALVRAEVERAAGRPIAGEATADLFEKLADDLGLADALIEAAASRIALGEAGKALPLLESARDIAADTGSVVRMAEAARLAGVANLTLKEPVRAMEFFAKANEILTGHGLASREASALLDLAEAALVVPDPAKAAEAVGRARAVYDAWGKTGSGERARGAARGNARGVLLLGKAKLNNGEVAAGLKLLNEARDRADSIRDAAGRDAALAVSSLADPELEILRAAGVTLPPPPSADTLAKLLPLYGVTRPADSALGPALVSLGQRLLTEGELGRAQDLLRAGFDRLPVSDRVGRAAALVAYAEAAALSGRFPAALNAIDAAIGYEADPKVRARLRAIQGRYQVWQGDPAATTTLQRALTEANSNNEMLGRGLAQLELGRLLLKTDPAAAQSALSEAITALDTAKAPALALEARAWRSLSDPGGAAEALTLISTADTLGDPGLQLLTRLVLLRLNPTPDVTKLVLLPDLLDRLRQRRAPIPALGLGPGSGMELRGLQAWWAELLGGAVLLSDAGKHDEAFRLLSNLQGGESADWVELHIRRAAQGNARKDPVSSELVRVSMDDAFARVEALDLPTVPAAAQAILSARADAAFAQLAASYRPILAEGQRDVKARTLAEVQRGLTALDARGEPTRILGYFSAGDQLFIQTVSATSHRVLRVNTGAELLRSTTGRVHTALTATAPRGGEADKALLADLVMLHGGLITPIQADLPADARLLVVPTGFVREVPFDALLGEVPAGVADLSAMPYLIRSHTIGYLPASDWMMRLREPVEGEINRPPTLGVLEGPAASGAETTLIRSAVGAGGVVSRCATDDITVCKKGPGLAGFLEMGRAELDLIHLSATASADGEPAGLRLGNTETLYPNQARHTLLYTDLVVVPPGPASLELGRAMLSSRVRTTVSGLHDAGDAANRRWWTTFYKTYAAATAAESLDPGWKVDAAHAASLSLLDLQDGGTRPYAHPFYWSGRVVLGAPN